MGIVTSPSFQSSIVEPAANTQLAVAQATSSSAKSR
jgi:hypothetical protein